MLPMRAPFLFSISFLFFCRSFFGLAEKTRTKHECAESVGLKSHEACVTFFHCSIAPVLSRVPYSSFTPPVKNSERNQGN